MSLILKRLVVHTLSPSGGSNPFDAVLVPRNWMTCSVQTLGARARMDLFEGGFVFGSATVIQWYTRMSLKSNLNGPNLGGTFV